jgi:murein DD-endopeptidase MepM/ murein hydrolase activator NlpD
LSRSPAHRSLSRSLVAALAVSFLVTAVPEVALAEPTSKELRAELETVTRRLHKAEAREARILDAARDLEERIAAAMSEQADLQSQLAVYARATYMAGQGDPIIQVMTEADADSTLERLALLEQATRGNRLAVQRARALDHELRVSRAQLAAQREQAAKLHEELAADSKRITALLTGVAAKEKAAARERTDRASRQGGRPTVIPGGARGGYHCPVGPSHHFTDTWGAPRPGGRRHKGTDIFAPYGSPVYAVASGVIQRVNWGSTSGLAIQLRAVDGNVYFYAHESSASVKTGQAVQVGQLIGRVGNSGNAAGRSPHVHFELWAGGGAPVNPYPFARRVCG